MFPVNSIASPVLLFSLGVLLACATTPASAQSPAPPPAKKEKVTPVIPAWAINCQSAPGGKGLNCQMARAVVLKEKRKLLLKVTVSLPAQTKKPVMLIQMPHGLYLPAGAKLQIDENAPQSVVLQTCDQKGCYSGAPVSNELLAAIKKGRRLKVTFQNLKKKPITVALPLDGFTYAYEQMERR